jgi:hypothetical protein
VHLLLSLDGFGLCHRPNGRDQRPIHLRHVLIIELVNVTVAALEHVAKVAMSKQHE